MAIDNEELMQQLQRFAVLSRRSRHAHVKRRIEEEGGERKGRGECGHEGHRHGRDGVAFDDPTASHGYGNHKCHGGSGRHGQNRVLAALCMQDGLSQKDLAYLLGIRPQSLSEAIDKLEASELVVRRQSEEDRRVTNVFLTDGGRRRAAKVAEDRKKSAQDVFGVLTEEEKDQLASIMDKLIGKLDADLSDKGARKAEGPED